MNSNIIDHIYITEINDDFNCDIFFPEIPQEYTCIKKNQEIIKDKTLTYKTYIKNKN